MTTHDTTGALNPGCLPMPEGKDNCLDGLTFVLTGAGVILSLYMCVFVCIFTYIYICMY